jgi:hypothetical protein
VSTQSNSEESRSRLNSLRSEIERGLERYLQVKGPERSQLTIQLLRLRWEAEELEAATRSSAS